MFAWRRPAARVKACHCHGVSRVIPKHAGSVRISGRGTERNEGDAAQSVCLGEETIVDGKGPQCTASSVKCLASLRSRQPWTALSTLTSCPGTRCSIGGAWSTRIPGYFPASARKSPPRAAGGALRTPLAPAAGGRPWRPRGTWPARRCSPPCPPKRPPARVGSCRPPAQPRHQRLLAPPRIAATSSGCAARRSELRGGHDSGS